MESSRPEYWSGLLFPSPGDLSDPGIEPRSPALQEVFTIPATQGSPWLSHWSNRDGYSDPSGGLRETLNKCRALKGQQPLPQHMFGGLGQLHSRPTFKGRKEATDQQTPRLRVRASFLTSVP